MINKSVSSATITLLHADQITHAPRPYAIQQMKSNFALVPDSPFMNVREK